MNSVGPLPRSGENRRNEMDDGMWGPRGRGKWVFPMGNDKTEIYYAKTV